MKKTKNTTISEDMYERAERIMRLRKFDDYSEFVAALIREEWERRNGPDVFKESDATPLTATPPGKPVTYRKASRKGTHHKIPDIVKKGVETERSAQSQPKPDA